MVTVPIILDQTISYSSHYFGPGCWLRFLLFWIRLLVTVPNILDQAVGYCSYYFGSDCLLLFPNILDQAVGYCSHYFESGCWLYSSYFLDQAVSYCLDIHVLYLKICVHVSALSIYTVRLSIRPLIGVNNAKSMSGVG